MKRDATARLLLILGLSFVFLTFGIWKFVQPFMWIGWIPLWMDGLLGLPKDVWLTIIAITEILFAVLLIIPRTNIRKVIVILMALHLVAVISTAGWNDIGVRDTGLLFSAVALYFLL